MESGYFTRIVMKGLLGLHIGIFDHATAYTAHAYVAAATVVQHIRGKRRRTLVTYAGWIGVAVSPMTAAFAESLGMI
jgi:hypothetical protein